MKALVLWSLLSIFFGLFMRNVYKIQLGSMKIIVKSFFFLPFYHNSGEK